MSFRFHITLVYCLLFTVFSKAQDIHFSQFNGSLLNLSPGFTGLFNGDYRFGAIYRGQWASVPVSYATFSMHGERRIKPLNFEKDMIGVGLLFNSDRAGDSRYGTTQLYLNGNYIFLAKADSSLIITFGLNAGWSQVGFDFSKMTFDNQFDGIQLNSGLGSGEQFNWTRRNYADVNVGSVVQYILSNKQRFLFGFGMYHLTSPVISYQGNDLSRLDYKFSNYLNYTAATSANTDLISELLISKQGKSYEFIPHISLKYHVNKTEEQAVSAGLCYRTNDAVIFRLGYFHKTFTSGIAYDINTSNFRAATNRRGAFEIFANYIIRVKPSFIAKKRNCPVFI